MANQKPINTNTEEFQAHILIVSDDPDIARIWAFSLEQYGLRASVSDMGEPTMVSWSEVLPDLVVVDSRAWQMEDVEFCRKLRQETIVPILLFTSQNDEYYLLEAYQTGVDEVVPQPISPRLFTAKIKAWLRRSMEIPSSALDCVEAGEFRLDAEHRLLNMPDGRLLRLTHLDTRLLYLLMSHPNHVQETSTLVERVWGYYGTGDTNLLRNLVYRLRRKIETDPVNPQHIVTKGNIGYMFQV